jgi:hypothetical protein
MYMGNKNPNYTLYDALQGFILHNKSSLAVYYNIRYHPHRRREHRGSAGHGLKHDVQEYPIPHNMRGEDRGSVTKQSALCLKG